MPLSGDFLYQLGESGIILNADEISQPFVDITKINGFDSAPFRSTERDHEGTDGGFMDAEFEKGRPISLEGTAYAVGSDLEPYLDVLKSNWAPSRTAIPLYFSTPGVGERVLFIKPLGCRYDIDTDRRLGMARVQFSGFAEDPRFYDSTLSSIDIYQGEQIVTGRGYPRGYPYSYGAITTVEGTNLVVAGNRPTPARFIITGPVNKPQIINETSGKSLIFDINLGSNDNLVIDTQYKSILLNGANRRSVLREPNWFFLNTGTNFIRYRAESFNLVTGPTMNVNPYFEVDINNWTVSGGTITQSTAQFHQGTASLLLTPDGVSAQAVTRSEDLPYTTKVYEASAWVRCAVARNVTISIDWSDGSHAFISSSSSTVAVLANTWTLLTFQGTAPVNTAFIVLTVSMSGTPLVGHTLNVDEATVKGIFSSALNVQFRSAWR